MATISPRDVVSFANNLAKKCLMPQRVTSLHDINSDFILLVYYAVMGELPKDIYTESRTIKAQSHNIQCVVDVLANEYLHTNLSHISGDKVVSADEISIYNLLEILDGMLDFMLEHLNDEDTTLSTSFHEDKLESECEQMPSGLSSSQLTEVKTSETERDTDCSGSSNSQHSLEPLKTSWDLKDISISSVEGELKPLKSLKEMRDSKKERLELSRGILPVEPVVSNDELARCGDETFKVSRRNDLEKCSDNYSSSSGGFDFADGGKPIRESSEDRSLEEDQKSKEDNLPVELENTVDHLQLSDGSKSTNKLPKKDWKTLMANLHQTVEDSRRIREKYYSKSSDTSFKPSCTDVDEEVILNNTSSYTEANDSYESVKSFQTHERKVRFDCSDGEEEVNKEKQFEDVLYKEQQLQDMKNKLLEYSYLNHLEEVKDAERKKMEPLKAKASAVEEQLKEVLKGERKQLKKQSKNKEQNLVSTNAVLKSYLTNYVRKMPQRSFGVHVKKKISNKLSIGEHDLLPVLLSKFPGLTLSKPVLDSAWRKQFRQIETLSKMEDNHQARKRANDLKLQHSHQSHQLLTDIMRKEHEQTQRVKEARRQESIKRSAKILAKERKQQTARIRRYYSDYQLRMRSKMIRRRTKEEKIFKHLFEEGLEIQKSRVRDLRKYAKDKRDQLQNYQRNQIASLENYYRDQFEILAEDLRNEKRDLKIRDKAQSQLVRQMRSGLKKKMEREIEDLQEQIFRDDDDAHFRQIEADRVRRQLQLATYHAKFKPN